MIVNDHSYLISLSIIGKTCQDLFENHFILFVLIGIELRKRKQNNIPCLKKINVSPIPMDGVSYECGFIYFFIKKVFTPKRGIEIFISVE